MVREIALLIATAAAVLVGPDASFAKAKKAHTMETSSTGNAVKQSIRMIEAIMKDIAGHYRQIGGGGITEIRMTATNIYQVSISQEERVDVLTYELDAKPDGSVVIKKRSESTQSPH
jgi:hypothetical protein